MAFLYLLAESDTGWVRYVGQTRHPARRLAKHRAPGHNRRLSSWVDELSARGARPEMIVLREVADADVLHAERAEIAARSHLDGLLNAMSTFGVDDPSDAARALAQWLNDKALSQSDGARLLEMTQANLSSLVRGVSVPKVDAALRIQDVAGISCDSWFTRAGAWFSPREERRLAAERRRKHRFSP